MIPFQNGPNMDVVRMQRSPLLDEEALSELRQCEDPEHVPDVNLFAIAFEEGPAWMEARAERFFANGGTNNAEYAHELAKEMTISIQQEHDVCLPDYRLTQMYGMSHDFARLALGIRITAPEGRIKKPKSPVMHRKRILEYAKEPM